MRAFSAPNFASPWPGPCGASICRCERGSTLVVLSGFTASATAERIGWMRQAAGARFDGLELNALLQTVAVTGRREAVAEEWLQRLRGLTPAEILDSPYLLIGTVDQMAEELQARRERLSISYYVVFEAALDALAPVVARLAGT